MRLNNKGYLIIEIVLASVIAFGVAYFLFDLTLNVKNKSDDLQANTIVMSDKGVIENYIMRELKSADSDSIKCYSSDAVEYKKNSNTYLIYIITEDEQRKFVNKQGSNIVYKKTASQYVDSSQFTLTCTNNGATLSVFINNRIKLTNENYDIELKYVYN